ncbi:hypothetical protein WA1_30450 [Scytonema hofmannii PCC 7110]|uniref:Pepco domain-containing protein n=1 Tax=Scytonema hofmannii PCC 7110 TaxID=128403 RepID=A0A139X4M1_9CYAN|nr:hypothetical protein [Scytonema hofmannii]KYC39661.1 hypothetical protein WA1_30450 [Scytonema hofmannii PCC 7110]
MSEEISSPDTIWILTEETSETETSREITTITGERSSEDTGGLLSTETNEEIVVTRKKDEIVITRRRVEVNKLKQEMKGFLQAMREMLDEAEQPSSKMQLDEVELSVEINGEGKISLLGFGGQAGGKGTMKFKFKRR